MNHNRWLVRRQGGSFRIRLYCFCYAGGNAFYFLPWQDILGPEIEVCAVQLPGRSTRLEEAPYTSFAALITDLLQVIDNEKHSPFAFFGHSLGGLIAFELARHCVCKGGETPTRLFVSGCSAPQQPSPSRRLHELEKNALIEVLKEYSGTPPAALRNRELMDLVLPAIRADFALGETYKYEQKDPLDIPITILAGTRDAETAPDDLRAWQKETTSTCRIEWFEGGHFFINTERAAVLECLRSGLRSL